LLIAGRLEVLSPTSVIPPLLNGLSDDCLILYGGNVLDAIPLRAIKRIVNYHGRRSKSNSDTNPGITQEGRISPKVWHDTSVVRIELKTIVVQLPKYHAILKEHDL
jgi:hypothetical protein